MKQVIVLLALIGMAIPAGSQSTNSDCNGAGRFRIFYSPHMRQDTFMLDTETGEVWNLKVDEKGNEFWSTMPRERQQ